MINRSKFDSSKKLVNTKISTARRKSSSWQKKWKLVENQKSSAPCVFWVVSLLDKNKYKLADKGFVKCQLLDTIYS